MTELPSVGPGNPIALRIIEVVAEAGNVSPAEVHADSTLSELGFDSLSALNLVFALEEEFDIDIPNDEVAGVQDVLEIIENVSRLLDNNEQ